MLPVAEIQRVNSAYVLLLIFLNNLSYFCDGI